MSDTTLFDDSEQPKPRKRRKRKIEVTETQATPTSNLPAVAFPPPTPPTIEERRLTAMVEFHDAYIEMAKELPTITKDSKIQLMKNGQPVGKPIRFASFENIHSTVVPILLKHGFRISFHGHRFDNGEFWMQTVLRRGIYGEESYWPVQRTAVSPAMNPSQADGSGGTYACRYGMVRLLNLNSQAPEDRDTDAVPEIKFITGGAATKLSNAIADAGLTEDRFCQKYGIPSIDKLPAHQLAEATQAVAAFKKGQQP